MFSPASGIEARTKIPPMFRRWKMFEHSLIDLEAKTQPRRRRWISLPLAIGLHLVGLTAFAFASYWNVGPVTEPRPQRRLLRRRPAAAGDPAGWRGIRRRPRQQPRPQPAPPVPQTQTVQPDLNDMPDKPATPAPGPTQESTVPGTDPTAPPGPGDPNGDPDSHNEVGEIHGTLEPVRRPSTVRSISRPR